jgi:hypothetical protein
VFVILFQQCLSRLAISNYMQPAVVQHWWGTYIDFV